MAASSCLSLSLRRVLHSTFDVAIDHEIFTYITGVLEGGVDEFESDDDVYDALGAVLHEVAGEGKDEEEIRRLCRRLLNATRTDLNIVDNKVGVSATNGLRRLDEHVDLKGQAKQFEDSRIVLDEIFNTPKDFSNPSLVDHRKLVKAETKLQEKKVKRSNVQDKTPSVIDNGMSLDDASVSQAVSKKDSRLEAKGGNNIKDVRIDNFDVSYKDRSLIKGADLVLAAERRYGLVGRNGLGKTTLLRAISGGHLKIPSHITVLHVEQEVVGDDTRALQSVLECDERRERLLKEEVALNAALQDKTVDDLASGNRLAAVYAELQQIDADKAPARASVILAGLGFDTEMQQRTTKEFSGGWRMRLALARALFSMPDLLLLDEPTNMLDIKAIIWLENYLENWPTTLLVVSHDRHFLNTVPTDILLLHNQSVDTYRGNYDNFIKAKTEKLKNQFREFEAQQQYRSHVQEFIDKFRYNAKRASLVQSKIKMLEKLPELKPVVKESEVVFRFPDPEKLSPPIIQLDDVNFHYKQGQPVLNHISLSANMESRICIVGENGAGKSTLLKILTGAVDPISGIRHSHRHLRVGYFSQHHVDQLDMSVSSVELMAAKFPGHPVEVFRQQLGRFGISGDLALQVVATLSGGQKSRVAFAVMTFSTPNFLILDEPTNHLDVETIDALGRALAKYQGGVVLVSHDEMLIRMVCKELWVCAKGCVRAIEGGFDEYREIVRQELKAQYEKK